MHVTRWAIESLPPGPLRDFFADPEVLEAALFGAAFPDSGYWVDDPLAREYGEYTHWEPFIQSFIDHLRTSQPPPFTTLEQRKTVAFLLGCGAHGLQDEIFDSLFLFQVSEHDEGDQGDADGGTDFFLVEDGVLPHDIEEFVPMEILLSLYEDLPVEITEDVVRGGVGALRSAYINESVALSIARAFVEDSKVAIPWTRDHYLDPDIPGSLVSEIAPTAAYLEAMWRRLHGDGASDPLVVHRYPDGDRPLRTAEPLRADSYVTFIFGQGVHFDTTDGRLSDASGRGVEANFEGTRWGHPQPRLVRLQPTEFLREGGRYVATLEAGAVRIDGTVEAEPSEFTFDVVGAPMCGPARLARRGVAAGPRALHRCSRPGRFGKLGALLTR